MATKTLTNQQCQWCNWIGTPAQMRGGLHGYLSCPACGFERFKLVEPDVGALLAAPNKEGGTFESRHL